MTNEQTELLQEILKWIRFSSIGKVRTVLMDILDTEEKRLTYHLSDGEHGSIEIGNQVGISHGKVTYLWRSWKRLGIVESLRVRGGLRYRKLFELEDFGFSVPEIEPSGGDE